jgi:molybdopterin converting factor small subunit
MLKLVLPAYLAALLPDHEPARGNRRSLWLEPGPWPALVEQLQARFPRLANRLVQEHGQLANGFVLVVNDSIVHDAPAGLDLRAGDEVTIIAAVAGG